MQEFQAEARTILLRTAHESIEYGLHNIGRIMPIDLKKYPEQLQQIRSCFVTLHLHDQLRGCIGSLEAHEPLILDVSKNAYNAAFRDPRFAPVTLREYANLHLDISILSQPQPMQFVSEQDLLQQLRPGIDGLILADLGHRGTFLPSVWEQLPDKHEFLTHLKMKAGLPTTYWSNTISIQKYSAELIS